MALREHGYRDGHGQLEPRDRLHRLRHLRRALLRAAHARGRAGDRARRAAARGRGAARRADAAPAGARRWRRQACGSSARRPRRSTCAEDRGRFEALARELGVAQPPERHRATRVDEARRGGATGSATRCWCGPPTCWAAGRWRSCTTTSSLRSYFDARGAGRARAPGADRPLPRGRVRGRRGRDRATARRCVIGGVMQHIEDAGIHSGDSACVLPPYLITERAGRGDAAAHPGVRASGSASSG